MNNTPDTTHLAPYKWKPGDPSPNPGGRPKGLVTYIREKTKDGEEIADFLMEVMRGGNKVFGKLSDRLKAAELLLDRGGWPKSPVFQDPNATPLPTLHLSDLNEAELGALEQFGLVLASIRQRIAGGTAEAETK